jgi:hypothetical protein
MQELHRILLLQEIERIWKSFGADMQPNGVWIAEHKSVPLDFVNIIVEETPEYVYFLDKTGILETDILNFQKFTNFSETPIRYKNKRTFETGLAMFAKYENNESNFYYCYQFGGLFGKGYQIAFNDAGGTTKFKNIWVS